MKNSIRRFCFYTLVVSFLWSPLGFSDNNKANNIRNPDWDNRLPEKGKLGKLTKDWLRTQRRRLGVGPNVPLKFETLSSYRDGKGEITYRFKPYVHGIPVAAKHIVVHINESTRDVLGMRGRLNLEGLADIRPRINRGDAIARVARHGLALTDIVGDAELVFLTRADDTSVLSWQVEVKYGEGLATEHDFMFFDAMTGNLTGRHAQIHRSRNRMTYDAQGTATATLVRGEVSEDTGIECLDDVHNNAGTVYDYYKSQHSRDSYNNAGATIQSVVNVKFLVNAQAKLENEDCEEGEVVETETDSLGEETEYCVVRTVNNARWTGSSLQYGEGDGINNSCFSSLDLVAHEYTHAVTEHTAGLIYQNESGALNESWSDAFGAVIEAHANGGVDDNTWLVSEEFTTPNIQGDAVRYMNDPAEDEQSPDIYSQRWILNPGFTASRENDWGMVHFNSGIPNLAFYLLSQGGTHPRGKTTIDVSGIGISRAAKIWYDAQTTYMDPNETMHEARASTLVSAFDLYGHDDMSQVANAWGAVGVGEGSNPLAYACDPYSFSDSQSTISDIYIAYYGRPADASGMDFWSNKLTINSGDLNAIMASFADSPEFIRRFGGLNNTELVINIYQQLFNRNPDSGGLAFYVNSLTNGTRTLHSIALDILNGAVGSDLAVLDNRREVASDHYRHVVTNGLGLTADQIAKLMSPITGDYQTVKSACADSLLLSESAN